MVFDRLDREQSSSLPGWAHPVRTVTRLLADAGFTQVEIRMWDLPEMYTPYLPAPLAGLATTWHRAAYRLGRPQLMGHLSFKATL